jgi:hypothetical protein
MALVVGVGKGNASHIWLQELQLNRFNVPGGPYLLQSGIIMPFSGNSLIGHRLALAHLLTLPPFCPPCFLPSTFSGGVPLAHGQCALVLLLVFSMARSYGLDVAR